VRCIHEAAALPDLADARLSPTDFLNVTAFLTGFAKVLEIVQIRILTTLPNGNGWSVSTPQPS